MEAVAPEVVKHEDRYDFWSGYNPYYLGLFNQEIVGFCNELLQSIHGKSLQYSVHENPEGYFNAAIDAIRKNKLEKVVHFIHAAEIADPKRNDFSTYITTLAWFRSGSFSDGFEQIPEASQYYCRAQYLIGLSIKRWADKPSVSATQAFFNAAFKGNSVGSEEVRQKARAEFYKQLDSHEAQKDFLKRDVFYTRAAMAGDEEAKQKVAHLFTSHHENTPEFLDHISATARYKILQGLHVHGEHNNAKYVWNLVVLQGQLNANKIPLKEGEDKNKLLDKIECEILRRGTNLHDEEAIERFFNDSTVKGKKLTRLKEHVLGESKLSDYWRGCGRLIKDKWNESPIFFIVMSPLSFTVGAAMALVGFAFYAPYQLGKKISTAWTKREGGQGRSVKEQTSIDESIKAYLPYVEKEVVERKREKVSVRYMGHSLKFFPDAEHVARVNTAKQQEQRRVGSSVYVKLK